MATTEEKKHEAAAAEKRHAQTGARLPPQPIKKYRVVKEFVTANGGRYLAPPPPVKEEEKGLISLSEEDAKAALEEGAVEEVIIEPPPAPTLASNIPPWLVPADQRDIASGGTPGVLPRGSRA